MKGSEDYYYDYGSGSSAGYDSYDDFDLIQCGKGGSTGAKRGVGKTGGSSQTGTAYSQKHIRLREARKGGGKQK
eukprot:CAMPEP_0113389356 /NCGR_PEP_ID=MMETSP0013_2-20120614/9582_1 /TAXON_ID=2843 ORGANISM="Skeletonema costatum, Strain 1716" /NCGR_SAMPLE_ID=MMETSP0013_2 /ASSEMBLY_ACC=CAM_ASM_000158 /LENGTH=73 /DNA_ID=CAMNT_0000272425 /DNA_START=70 /DNA_END=291 /DNA_ORIENTATION=+ /assembly_acc=CAM_ASM_000158